MTLIHTEKEPVRDLLSYIHPVEPESEETGEPQDGELEEADENAILELQSLPVGILERVRFTLDVMLITFPLWFPDSARVTRNGGLVDVIYMPPTNYQANTESFVRRVIWYSSIFSDHFVKYPGIKRIHIWASAKDEFIEDTERWAFKKLNLTIKTGQPELYLNESIFKLAEAQPERYLELTSARWLRPDQFPQWGYSLGMGIEAGP